MDVLLEITGQEIGRGTSGSKMILRTRKASRAVVFNDAGEIALLYVSRDGFYKLPGGGIEEGESAEAALHREVMEEAGVRIDIIGEVGKIIEYRLDMQLMQVSSCYLAKTIDEAAQPSFTQEEIRDGFELKWVSLYEALPLLDGNKPDCYHGKFVRLRDMAFLKKAMEIVNVKNR